ncbi:hypothetical protein QWY81_09225 [Polaribacter undariae]|uniref:Uncharacterized protein n=1 Tax=Polaribacter sejongensis TaxID=985043 RepID=A0AAJ1VGA4_9FLAO|nr:hypothetical protein [Polaribacter undariae]MDN3619633.1 hypothetical protein [Polaribacter undariae]UWD32253.1 hypothetical protein NQP51_00985 [Polaribacter undariae]
MTKPAETPVFKFYTMDEYYEDIKKCKNFPEDFYYEIFVIAKATSNKKNRTECANIIKKQAPEALQIAFKSRKRITQKGKRVARMISILEYGLLSEDLDLLKLHNLIGGGSKLWFFHSSTDFLDRLLEHPHILRRFNGVKSLEIHLKDFGNKYDSILNEISKLTSLEEIDLEGDYEQLPEDFGNLNLLS